MLKRLFVFAVLLLSATGASAAVVLSLQGGQPSESGGVFTYKYDAVLQAGAVLQPDDFFTLYDFAALGTLTPTTFTADPNLATFGNFSFGVTQANSGPIPPSTLIAPKDDAGLPNVTVTLLQGSDNIVPKGLNVPLGTLTLTSTIGDLRSLPYGSEFSQGGLNAANISSVSGPVPEPSTYAFMGLGLLAVGALTRRLRSRR